MTAKKTAPRPATQRPPARARRRLPGGSTMTTTVLVAEDESLVRAGCVLLLGTAGDIEVVGEATNGEEAVTLAGTLRPDVVLMDLRMPVLDGIEATRAIVRDSRPIAARPPRVLVLTSFNQTNFRTWAMHAIEGSRPLTTLRRRWRALPSSCSRMKLSVGRSTRSGEQAREEGAGGEPSPREESGRLRADSRRALPSRASDRN